MSNLNEETSAIRSAITNLQRTPVGRDVAAKNLAGDIHCVRVPWVLSSLKASLKDWNSKTEKWKGDDESPTKKNL